MINQIEKYELPNVELLENHKNIEQGKEIETSFYSLRSILESAEYKSKSHSSTLDIPIGIDQAGIIQSMNLSEIGHLLIAGQTGSGKTTFLNTIIITLLMKFYPEDLKFILIDPKCVEFEYYKNLPHIIPPIITYDNLNIAIDNLNWLCNEMENRYKKFSKISITDITEYNSKKPMEKLPYIIIIIDEFSDMMAKFKDNCEKTIIKLASMSCTAGIHLIISTGRETP